MLHRALDRFERIERAALALLDLGDFALDGVDRQRLFGGRHACGQGLAVRAAKLFDMHQEIGDAALDRFEMAEPRVGGIEALHQRRDAVFQMRQSGVIGVGQLHPFEFFDQPREQFFKLVGDRGSASVEAVSALVSVSMRFSSAERFVRSPRCWRAYPLCQPASVRLRRPWSASRWTPHGNDAA